MEAYEELERRRLSKLSDNELKIENRKEDRDIGKSFLFLGIIALIILIILIIVF